MKKIYSVIFLLSFLLFVQESVTAQRKSENLGRGVIAVNQGGGKIYVSWRLLGTDPDDIAFNIYRSVGLAAFIKLNTVPIVATTDYVDNSASTSLANSYIVKPVINGVEMSASAPYTLNANSPVQLYQRIAVQPINGKNDYNMKFCWVGDLNGDGEYDYVVDRLPMAGNPSPNGGPTAKIEGYLNDGTFKWRVDAGPNVEISTGHNDHVTVFDMDGDGIAEVILKTSEGTVFGDGTSIPDMNGDGITDYRDSNGEVFGHAPQYISVINGSTGKEMARAVMPHQDDPSPSTGKKHWQLGAFRGHFGIMYMDGIHPSFLFQYTNRNSGAPYDKSFNQFVTTWDYKNGQLIQRTDWKDEAPFGEGCFNHFHQIRVVDVDRDGKDEMVEGGFVLDDNGKPLWGNCEIVHGDRHQTGDFDPDYPGLETFFIQQNNPSSLGMGLVEAATGKFIKKWYQSAQGDVGRGEALDIDPNHKGVELFSTMSGLYSAKGEFLAEKNMFPNSGIWWDGDLLREMLRAPDGNGFNIHINKPGLSGGIYTEGPRLIEIAKESGWLVKAEFGCRPMFEGDIQGDWREELVLKEQNADGTECVAFRIYTTTIPAQQRIYCLMQNPAYRQTVTTKGYYQAPYTDYYLGAGMAMPPMPPIQTAKLSWKGGLSSNVWDVNTTANWTNNDAASAFSQNDDVMLDIRGAGNTDITLSGIISPSSVLVNSPVNYTFNGTGSLSGTMSLIKAGSGVLTYNTSNDYSGTTIVNEGSLFVNAGLPKSPVSVNWHAVLGGTGTIVQEAAFKQGAVIVPATEGVAGTLTFSKDVTLSGDMNLRMDLSDEPAGITKKHDKIQINGNLILTGINTISVNQLNGSLPAGTYNLISYTGSFSGEIANLKISGITGKKYNVTNTAGVISVIIEDTRDAGKVTWAGKGSGWDILTSVNWLNKGNPDVFAPNDSVIFNAEGSARNEINITAGSMPVKDMVVETGTTNYKFSGTGSISGSGGITKNGSGILSLLTKNDYTGKTTINNGTFEIGYLDDAGLPSSVGATTSTDTSFFVLNNAYLKYSGVSNIYTNRGLTLAGSVDTIDVSASGKQITLKGVVGGPAKLVKTGAGSIILQQQQNKFRGGVVVKAGTLVLGDDIANRYGLGPENATITLEGGSLSMFASTSYNDSYWNLVVPSGSTANFYADDRCLLYGSLTGGGTMNMYIPYVRTEMKGNWAEFTGKINVYYNGSSSGNGHFRINNSNGYVKTAINLAGKIDVNHVTSGKSVEFGELSGIAGSSLSNINYTVGGLNTDATFGGKIYGNSVTKTGTGTWTLTDTSLHTNATTINGGKILLPEKALIKGPVVVNNTGIICGAGKINGLVTINQGGTIQPGSNSVGKLTINNNLNLLPGSNTEIEISKTTNTCDQIVSSGTIVLSGTLKMILNGSSSYAAGDQYKIFNATSVTRKFQAIDPAVPGTSLVWDTTALRSSGIISVKSSIADGFNEIDHQSGIFFFPNPVHGKMTVQMDKQHKNAELVLHTLNGMRIYSLQVKNSSAMEADLSELAQGVYILEINADGKKYVSRIVKN